MAKLTKKEQEEYGFEWYEIGHDFSADLNGYGKLMNRSATFKILKFAPIFFLNEEDQHEFNVRPRFGDLFRVWLIFNNGKYHVFLNNQILSYYGRYYDADYDVSYPVLRTFDEEEEAVKFYNKIKELTDAVGIKESITKRFHVENSITLFTKMQKWDVSEYYKWLDTYEKTFYYFNECQIFAVLLHKYDYHYKDESVTKDNYYIILNRKLEIEFETQEDRDSCWEYLVDFYNQFEEDEIEGISNQRFLPKFIDELARRSGKVEGSRKDTYYRTKCLICNYKGYKIFFKIDTVCSQGLEMIFRLSKCDGWNESKVAEVSCIWDIKQLLRRHFPQESWMKKYGI